MGYVKDIRSKIGHDEFIGVGAGIFIYKDNKVLLQKEKPIYAGPCMPVD